MGTKTEALLEGEPAITEIDELRPLIAEGQERGFLTFEQIASCLEEVEVTKEQIIELHAFLEGDVEQVRLTVGSDGPPIPPEVERYLFEPFFSTRSRGTGLGLYICRELCERYGAGIEYRLQGAPGANRNEFQVTMRRASLAQTQIHLHP